MGQVYTTEIPGGDLQAWQCPNCSKAYPMQDEDGRSLQCPGRCARCDCPMDIEQAKKFADAEAMKTAGTIARPMVRV